jgi:hypothetical protein
MYHAYSRSLVTFIQVTLIEPNTAKEWLALLLYILEIQGSNLYPETDYLDRGLSFFSSVSPGKCSVSNLN